MYHCMGYIEIRLCEAAIFTVLFGQCISRLRLGVAGGEG